MLVVEQDVIGSVTYAARYPFPPNMDLSERELLIKLRDSPASHLFNRRRDELRAYITLGEGFFVDGVLIVHSWIPENQLPFRNYTGQPERSGISEVIYRHLHRHHPNLHQHPGHRDYRQNHLYRYQR